LTAPEFAATLRSPLLKIVGNSGFISARVKECLDIDSPTVYELIRLDE
jgi:hypothetical protein